MRNLIIDPGTLALALGECSPVKPLTSGLHCEIKTCPLCKNDKWKATVNLENGWFFCQVCQAKGVHINQLVPATEDAMLRAYMEGKDDDVKAAPVPLPPIPALCERVDMLPGDHPGIQYLVSRRISPNLAAMKQMLWKPWGISAWEKKDPKTGEVKQVFNTLQGFIHQMFRRGELTAWQFEAVPRVMGSSLPKYCTAPGSELGSSFFNFDDVSKERRCVVVEGVYDAYRIPFNGVAVCKNKLSKRQVKLLSTCSFDEIILVLDSDQTDKHMSTELAKLKAIAPARAVRLKQGDPADHHEDALLRAIGLREPDLITTRETLRQAFMSVKEIAAERTKEWEERGIV